MTTTSSPIAPHLHAFFTTYLGQHKRASPQTVASCRDTFRLLLLFVKDTKRIEPTALALTELDVPTILAFLTHLEEHRGNTVRSRNIRLSAIRSFFRFVALREPEHVDLVTRILAIPIKRQEKKLIGYLTREEMEAILAAPDRSQWVGRRDYALLLTMYNSGARVSEMTTLTCAQVAVGGHTFVHLHGKGRKERAVPLWPHTGHVLQDWFRERGARQEHMAFPNARGNPLSRHGVNYLVHQAVAIARTRCPSLQRKQVTPHVIRHTTAMHLLQSGIDIATIALWLGHESIDTTHIYLAADLEAKERALQKLTPIADQGKRFTAEDPLLAFLTSL
jgi:site-specific recombinase XerD